MMISIMAFRWNRKGRISENNSDFVTQSEPHQGNVLHTLTQSQPEWDVVIDYNIERIRRLLQIY